MGRALCNRIFPLDCNRDEVENEIYDVAQREGDVRGNPFEADIEWLTRKPFSSKEEAFEWLENEVENRAERCFCAYYCPLAVRYSGWVTKRDGKRVEESGWAVHFEFHV